MIRDLKFGIQFGKIWPPSFAKKKYKLMSSYYVRKNLFQGLHRTIYFQLMNFTLILWLIVISNQFLTVSPEKKGGSAVIHTCKYIQEPDLLLVS